MAREIGILNARKVETLNEPGRHADGGNLYLSISENGGKRWVFLYRFKGTRKEMALCSWRPEHKRGTMQKRFGSSLQKVSQDWDLGRTQTDPTV